MSPWVRRRATRAEIRDGTGLFFLLERRSLAAEQGLSSTARMRKPGGLRHGEQKPYVTKSSPVPSFPGRTAIGVQREMDGPRDLSLALSVSAFAASVANRNPWGAAAAGLRFFGTMVELHSFPSILYGLLVTEGSLGSIQIDILGYNQYF